MGTLLTSAIPESLPPPWLPPSPSPQASPSGCYDGGWEGAEGCVKDEWRGPSVMCGGLRIVRPPMDRTIAWLRRQVEGPVCEACGDTWVFARTVEAPSALCSPSSQIAPSLSLPPSLPFICPSLPASATPCSLQLLPLRYLPPAALSPPSSSTSSSSTGVSSARCEHSELGVAEASKERQLEGQPGGRQRLRASSRHLAACPAAAAAAADACPQQQRQLSQGGTEAITP